MAKFDFERHGIHYESTGKQDLWNIAKVISASLDDTGKLHYEIEWHLTNAETEEEALRNMIFVPGETIGVKSFTELLNDFKTSLQAAEEWERLSIRGE